MLTYFTIIVNRNYMNFPLFLHKIYIQMKCRPYTGLFERNKKFIFAISFIEPPF